MAQCNSQNERGEPCAMPAGENSQYCFVHDPERVRERAEARKKGGSRSRAGHGGNPENVPAQVRSLNDVLTLLDYTKDELLEMGNSITRARALIALAAAYTQAIQVGDFENRLAQLEAFYREQNSN